jgi:hypothetical protein
VAAGGRRGACAPGARTRVRAGTRNRLRARRLGVRCGETREARFASGSLPPMEMRIIGSAGSLPPPFHLGRDKMPRKGPPPRAVSRRRRHLPRRRRRAPRRRAAAAAGRTGGPRRLRRARRRLRAGSRAGRGRRPADRPPAPRTRAGWVSAGYCGGGAAGRARLQEVGVRGCSCPQTAACP